WHSFVQPPVSAFGYHATTTACFPLKSDSLYVFPSLPFSVKSGAVSPTFNGAAVRLSVSRAASAAIRTFVNFISLLLFSRFTFGQFLLRGGLATRGGFPQQIH